MNLGTVGRLRIVAPRELWTHRVLPIVVPQVGVGSLAASRDTGTGVKQKSTREMVVRSRHQPSEPGENRTGDRRKGSDNTTTNCSNKSII